MNVARILILGVALAAGGAAAYLVAGGDEEKKPEPAPVQFATVDVLIAKTDIAMGTAVNDPDLIWQAWPAATTGASLIASGRVPKTTRNVIQHPILLLLETPIEHTQTFAPLMPLQSPSQNPVHVSQSNRHAVVRFPPSPEQHLLPSSEQ